MWPYKEIEVDTFFETYRGNFQLRSRPTKVLFWITFATFCLSPLVLQDAYFFENSKFLLMLIAFIATGLVAYSVWLCRKKVQTIHVGVDGIQVTPADIRIPRDDIVTVRVHTDPKGIQVKLSLRTDGWKYYIPHFMWLRKDVTLQLHDEGT